MFTNYLLNLTQADTCTNIPVQQTLSIQHFRRGMYTEVKHTKIWQQETISLDIFEGCVLSKWTKPSGRCHKTMHHSWRNDSTIAELQDTCYLHTSSITLQHPSPTSLQHLFFHRQLDFSSEPGVANEILETNLVDFYTIMQKSPVLKEKV